MSRPIQLVLLLILIFSSLSFSTPAQAQLRIVDYNTAGVPNSAAMTTVLDAINDEVVNGVAKPIDVLILQEIGSGDMTTMTTILNGFGVGTYVAGSIGTTTGAGSVGLIYRAQSVDLLDQQQVVNTSPAGAARGVMRYQLRPDGYTSADAEFYIYSSHYKSADNGTDAARRNVEAAAIRANADGLGQGKHIIYAGDFNIYRDTEPMWGTLTGAGNGQAFDAMNPDAVGDWNENATFLAVHTQNPAGSGFVGGGMDDRFDWQMITGELEDTEGLSIVPNSYHAFGNDGTHNLNGHINTGDGNPTILNALGSSSDHLPVVADYQLPAILEAIADPIPPTFTLNQPYSFDVEVKNAAGVLTNTLVSLGADELDYTLSVSGDLISPLVTDMDEALNGSNLHPVFLDTSSPGLKSGIITVMSSSQAVEDGFVQIPVSFVVLGIPEPASLLLLAVGLGIVSFGRRS